MQVTSESKIRRPRARSHPSRVTVEEICRDMGLGELRVYSMLRENIIPNVRVGRNWIVARHAYELWKKSCGTAGNAINAHVA